MTHFRSRILLLACLLLFLPTPNTATDSPSLADTIESLGSRFEIREEMDVVVSHLSRVPRTRRFLSPLRKVKDCLASPWSVPDVARDFRDLVTAPLTSTGPLALDTTLLGIADWIDVGEVEQLTAASSPYSQGQAARCFTRVAENPDLRGPQLLTELSALMEAAHLALEEGCYRLDDDDIEILFRDREEFLEIWYRSHFPDRELSEEETKAEDLAASTYKRTLRRLDGEYLFRVARLLLGLRDCDLENRLAGLPRAKVESEEFTGDVLAIVGKTPAQRVVIGGPGKTHYSGPAALILDLGGDDTYARAAVNQRDMLASLVFDLGGNDTYEGDGPGPVAATAGFTLLVDRDGKDRYLSKRFGQCASAGGLALLIDEAGDDEYLAEDYAQGYTLSGISLLYDLGGNDKYTAHANAQGASMGRGFAALIDVAGDDEYLADLHWPDVYGNSGPNVYHGAAQGYATGLRGQPPPEYPGGFAGLFDLTGKDRYQSGNFSQGGGYYFAFGLMYDGGGNDENVGTRYSQGFGVHQAIGMRWDAAGDDHYKTRTVANCGSAWDEGIGFLVDDGGNDVYEAGGLSLAGAANTGIAVLIDRDGRDEYRSPPNGKDTQGGTGDSSYHKKPALALFLDLGGAKDTYTRKGRDNDSALHAPGASLFLDARGKTLDEVLRDLGPGGKD